MTGNPLLNVEEGSVQPAIDSNNSTRFLSPRRLPSPVVPRKSSGPTTSEISVVNDTDEEEPSIIAKPRHDGGRKSGGDTTDGESSCDDFGDIFASTLIEQQGAVGTLQNGIQLSSTGSGEDDSELEVGTMGKGSNSDVEESGRTDSSAEEESSTSR
jgi:hypothetical protein